MPEPEKVKYARQVVAQQMLADLAERSRDGSVSWEDYPLLPEREFIAAEEMALQVAPPPAEQYKAAYEFLAYLADNDEDSSRARGGLEPAPHLHLVHGLAPVGYTSVEQGAFVWHVPEGLVVGTESPFDPPAVIAVEDVTYDQASAALDLFQKSSDMASPIDAMWQVLKTDREEARRG